MSLSSDLTKHIYAGNGTTTTFDYTFDVLTEDDLHIFLIEVSTGTETELTTNFTITPSEGSFPSGGGTVTYPLTGTAITSAYKLAIVRTLEVLQPTVYPNNSALYPKVIEKSFDRITMIAQQQQEEIDRTLQFAITVPDDFNRELPDPVALKALRINSDATAFEYTTDPEIAANQAAASAAAAATSATNSASSATNAATSATAAAETANQLNNNLKINNQTNFIDTLGKMLDYNRMRFIIPSINNYEVYLDNGYDYIKYHFTKDNLDDFIKLDYGVAGIIATAQLATTDASSFTGTWNTSTINHYSTVVDSAFTCTLIGSELRFKHFADNRGGIFEFVVDGDTANPVTISTWSEITQNTVTQTVFTGLEPGVTHTVVGTFKGVDPLHAPTGGTARGWAYVAPGAPQSTFTGLGITFVNQAPLLASTSNKEFAFYLVKDAESGWVPDHGLGTAFKNTEPKFVIDGIERVIADIALNTFILCSSFALKQDIVGRFVTAGDLCKITLSETIDMSGVFSILGSLESLQPLRINAGYCAMMPTGFNEFITGIGNSKVNNGDDTYDYFVEEKDQVFGACVISADNKNFFGACQVDAPLKSMRIGQTVGKPALDQSIFVWKRASPPKIYWQPFADHYTTAGEKFSWSSRFLIGNITNVYDFIKTQ
jgi:hypothetical protein